MTWLQWVQLVELPVLGGVIAWIIKMRTELMARIDDHGKVLVEHKLDVARNYATNEYLKDVDKRLSDKIDNMDSKLDRVLDRLPRKPGG